MLENFPIYAQKEKAFMLQKWEKELKQLLEFGNMYLAPFRKFQFKLITTRYLVVFFKDLISMEWREN